MGCTQTQARHAFRQATVTRAPGLVALLLDPQRAVMVNEKTGDLASALSARDARFWTAVRGMLWVVGFAVPVYALYGASRDAHVNGWRRWLTRRFLAAYGGDRAYFRMAGVDNPGQRIADDINTFTSHSLNFLLILLGSLTQLVALGTVLWSLSQMLVGLLVVYALPGTGLSLLQFGRPLIRLNFWQLQREAAFRFRLVRLRENAESIAYDRGEKHERHPIADADLLRRCFVASHRVGRHGCLHRCVRPRTAKSAARIAWPRERGDK